MAEAGGGHARGGAPGRAVQAAGHLALKDHWPVFTPWRLWIMDRNFPGVPRIKTMLDTGTHVLIRVKDGITLRRAGDFLPGPLLTPASSRLLGGDAGDVRYPSYLINGRIRTAPRTFAARPGQRARIRFINAGADTVFRVALGGHAMTVTHTDGYPVTPVRADPLPHLCHVPEPGMMALLGYRA